MNNHLTSLLYNFPGNRFTYSRTASSYNNYFILQSHLRISTGKRMLWLNGYYLYGSQYACYNFPVVHLFEGFFPFGNRPNASGDGFYVQCTACEKGDDPFPNRPIMTETA